MKRYLNQLTYAKTQCEKRLVYLGWTDYAVEEAVEATTFEGKKVLCYHLLLYQFVCFLNIHSKNKFKLNCVVGNYSIF